jgi:hypothetical protein
MGISRYFFVGGMPGILLSYESVRIDKQGMSEEEIKED